MGRVGDRGRIDHRKERASTNRARAKVNSPAGEWIERQTEGRSEEEMSVETGEIKCFSRGTF